MRPTPARTTCPVRIARHFLDRLHERFPGVALTEGALQAELAAAKWYPAEGQGTYYALGQLAGRAVAMVVALNDGLANLVTVYEPRPGWERRLEGARPWTLGLVLALAA